MSGAAILTPEGVNTLLSTTEAATLCGVSAEAVRKWASRGLITAAGLDDRGRKLYRLRDIAIAERATRERARR